MRPPPIAQIYSTKRAKSKLQDFACGVIPTNRQVLSHEYVNLQDTIQTFYDITRQEVDTLELKISSKDREMELMEDNHRQDVRPSYLLIRKFSLPKAHAWDSVRDDCGTRAVWGELMHLPS